MEKKAVLVVSFGTSYLDTMEKTIVPIEGEIAGAMPQRLFHRAFTSGMIMKKLERGGLHIDSVPQALEALLEQGVEDVVVQPSHIMNGDEYNKLTAQAQPYVERFASFALGTPLLTTQEDYAATARALLADLPQMEGDTALVFMGHGTGHYANAAYCQLEYVFHDLGRRDILIGTVEGYPTLEEVLHRLEERPQVKKVILYPLMVVAGDHAQNDMAGEEPDSWSSQLTQGGYQVSCVLRGMGEYAGIRRLFAQHALEAQNMG